MSCPPRTVRSATLDSTRCPGLWTRRSSTNAMPSCTKSATWKSTSCARPSARTRTSAPRQPSSVSTRRCASWTKTNAAQRSRDSLSSSRVRCWANGSACSATCSAPRARRKWRRSARARIRSTSSGANSRSSSLLSASRRWRKQGSWSNTWRSAGRRMLLRSASSCPALLVGSGPTAHRLGFELDGRICGHISCALLARVALWMYLVFTCLKDQLARGRVAPECRA
mmetsp:Transcript_9756/g.22544  ORF Transcript_9756/g.22544 Transcript_9756/m.22544 type:complete len:226 (+) Transcript_9756:1248-1925(+)